MNTHVGPNRIWARPAALALAALLLVVWTCPASAAPLPKDGPPQYELEPLPQVR